MKIGIDGRAAKWYRGTGIGTYTYELISNLNSIDSLNDYLIFLPDSSVLDSLNSNFHIKFADNTENQNFWDQVSVPNILDDSKIDLYHVPQNGVGLSENINCNKVITLHDIIPLKMPETVSQRYLNIFNNVLPKLIPKCDGIITVSEFSKDDISKEFNFPKQKIYVTHLAAEKIYKPLNKEICKNIIKLKYSINNNFILYVGGFSPRKNILGLIESFSLLPLSIREKNTLVITGHKGISYQIYKERTEKLNISSNVIFTDFIPLQDMPIFYNAAKLLVYPSFYEGFGLPPLEAMACGTPVIASNVTSLPEVCENSAILINPEDTHKLSIAIQKLIEDKKLANEMIQKSLVRSGQFSWQKTALKTIQAYESVLKN
ncbi:MAG: glycosyltransferase family 4 protein [Clostridium sp.]|uniref:glycosyltransferase family 4 protein n=1 Tax=Clostridium sp. DSM 8431 TaxID=1761781 RepID=UPI0008E4FD00|nr:glycosyltransferase family 1 protein [Clostridium sp. DSM 8431]MCR4944096.1 glycosyltransferase family 4 protein [Clostridium sp.]SFU77059.1 Glycosyltransferase involved in cell wall bisynthesis [Clostridium sp. DSM 8431]